MRLFVALAPPPSLLARLQAVQDGLRASGADVKWVETKNLHLTLKFLGEVPGSRLPDLKGTLRDAPHGLPPFRVRFAGCGFFPPRGLPRVVWVGVDQGVESLTKLQHRVDVACRHLGFPAEDRPFSAHLTLGRVRSADRVDALKKAVALKMEEGFGGFDVEEFHLVESHLTPRGPIYEHLETFPLGARPRPAPAEDAPPPPSPSGHARGGTQGARPSSPEAGDSGAPENERT